MPNSFVTPWTVACQTPLSTRFPGQKYWSGLPFPSPGDLPNPGFEPTSPALSGGFFTAEPVKLGKACKTLHRFKKKMWLLIFKNKGFPCGSAGEESTCIVGDLGSIPGLGRSPVFWPGEFHGLYSPWGHKESYMAEWLSLCQKQIHINFQSIV